ncbi:MAG: hypothetical protein U1E36_01345 [Rickettsiales bacterium]
MVGVPLKTGGSGSGSSTGSTWLGSIMYYGAEWWGTKETDGFLTTQRREALLNALSPEEQAQVKEFEQNAISGLIKGFEEKEPGSSKITALKEYQSRNTAPGIIQDIALESVSTAKQQGVTEYGFIDYASKIINAVVAYFTGESPKIYAQEKLGIIGAIQANIAEQNTGPFADALYKNIMAHAAEKGSTTEQKRIEDLVSKNDLTREVFTTIAEKAGLDVTPEGFKGPYKPKDRSTGIS